MTNEHVPALDAKALVAVTFVVAIPDSSAFRATHDYLVHDDDGSLRVAVEREVASWWEGLGCMTSEVRAEVLSVQDRT